MTLYKVKYEYMYPECDDDIREAYIEANSFEEAKTILEENTKGTYESSRTISVEKLGNLFIKK